MNPKSRDLAIVAVCLLVPVGMVVAWLESAGRELESSSRATEGVAIASSAEDNYCTPELKKVLRRVAGACGLLKGGGRGCKPADAKTVAALSGQDFNMLFAPLAKRAAIVQFDSEQVDLDGGAQKLVEEAWGAQRGASFFFVVARASPDGDQSYNQQLSQKRAEAVLEHLGRKFEDPELEKEVGLLWLGEEYAQLSTDFCDWKRSREGHCNTTEINRSAFVTWVDCAI